MSDECLHPANVPLFLCVRLETSDIVVENLLRIVCREENKYLFNVFIDYLRR